MKQIYIDPQNEKHFIGIPDFFDAQAIQALFISFEKPVNAEVRIHNLMQLAIFLEQAQTALLLEKLLGAYKALSGECVPDVSVDIVKACATVCGELMRLVAAKMGSDMARHITVFVAVS